MAASLLAKYGSVSSTLFPQLFIQQRPLKP